MTIAMTTATAAELSAYLEAIQSYPFAALLVCITLVACFWARSQGGALEGQLEARPAE